MRKIDPTQLFSGGISAGRYLLTDPPSNQAPPAVSGTGAVGQPLTCAPGTWSGADAFDFLWLRDGAPLFGAIASTYVPLSSDAGTTLSCRVTARNAGGSATATSAGVLVFVPPPVPPSPPQRAARAQAIPVSARDQDDRTSDRPPGAPPLTARARIRVSETRAFSPGNIGQTA